VENKVAEPAAHGGKALAERDFRTGKEGIVETRAVKSRPKASAGVMLSGHR
jgi:hypothetical protein